MDKSLYNHIYYDENVLWFTRGKMSATSELTYTKSDVEKHLDKLTWVPVRQVGFSVNCAYHIDSTAVIEWVKRQRDVEELWLNFIGMIGGFTGNQIKFVEELAGALLFIAKKIKKINLALVPDLDFSCHMRTFIPFVSGCTNLKTLILHKIIFTNKLPDCICSAIDAIEMLQEIEITPMYITPYACRKLTRSLIKQKNLRNFVLNFDKVSSEDVSEFLLLYKFSTSLQMFYLLGCDGKFTYPPNFRLNPFIKRFKFGKKNPWYNEHREQFTNIKENHIENPHLLQEVCNEMFINEKNALIFTEPVEKPVKIDCTNVTSISIFNQDEETLPKCFACLSGCNGLDPVKKVKFY